MVSDSVEVRLLLTALLIHAVIPQLAEGFVHHDQKHQAIDADSDAAAL